MTVAVAERKRRMRYLSLVLVLAAMMAPLYPLYLSNFTLEHKVKLARQEVAVLNGLLRSDSRFLQVGAWNDTGGTVSVTGTLTSMADFAELRRVVGSTNPPLAVYVNVTVPGTLPGDTQVLPLPQQVVIGAPDR